MKGSPQPPGPARDGATGGSFFERSYRAFISYSHTDTPWANWLMKRLEGYRVPERFHGRAGPIGEIGARIAPVFRDRDELPTADDLGEAVQDALGRSATLIIICSPAAAGSRWVNEEAMVFKRLGRGDRVFALIVDGEPGAKDPAQECFPPALRFGVGADGALSDKPVELIAADAREHADGKEGAFIRLVAGLLGVGFDDLRQREHARRMRRMMWVTTGAVAGMALTLGLCVLAWRAREAAIVARNDAQRRQENSEAMMSRMLDDLKSRLERADSLTDLDASGKELLAYFQTLNPRDLTDTTLVQQAKAFTQIGEIRAKQLRYAEADTAFTSALQRTEALVARHPGDGAMLFERAQAEFWIGSMHLKRGDVLNASEWLVHYRDSAVVLAALDPKNVKWQLEAVSGLNNLAALELDRGNLEAARSGFTRELAVLQKMAAADPGDRTLEFKVTNIVSFLGTVAERAGDLIEAQTRFRQQTQLLDVLSAKDPLHQHWRERYANALAMEATLGEITAHVDRAREQRTQARRLLEELIAKNPTNRIWVLALLRLKVREAASLRAAGDEAVAQRLVADALSRLDQLEDTRSDDRNVAKVKVTAWRVEAESRLAGNRGDAEEAIRRALATGEDLMAKDRANDEILGEHLRTCLVAARIAAQRGDETAARRHRQRVIDLVEPRLRELRYWLLLDPAARALIQLGRTEESAALVTRLDDFGYRPLEPWPAAVSAPFASQPP